MEKLPSFVVNGGIKLPIGYRFCPTDEELVIHYLKRKAFSHPLPASVIPDFHVFSAHPSRLPGVGDPKEKRYFFSHREDHFHKRPVAYGYWKTIGKDKQIVASDSNQVVGMRKTLVFCEAKRPREARIQWVMHELRLLPSETSSNPSYQMAPADWAVYRIFQKRKLKRTGSNGRLSDTRKVQRLEDEKIKPSFIDFTVLYGSDTGPPPPGSPSLSEGSEIASNKLD
ncbi:NAC domain-containing protein 83-like [Prosopis cineraria]|uniref:NAC domain-containing protein 83-like n=1 Tax=Prosopis cineraria TaxID=364024 RepID=UPI00240F9B16|nr:NAC domain-containing protein 83-like [Prosopis cineraria]